MHIALPIIAEGVPRAETVQPPELTLPVVSPYNRTHHTLGLLYDPNV